MKVCTLISGSSGNAIYIETARAKVMIDAGQSGKTISKALEEACGRSLEEIDGLLLTHGHRDHISGAGVLARKYHLPVYATEGTWCELDSLPGSIKDEQKNYICAGESLEIVDLKIEPFPVSHDAMEPVGYLLSAGKKTLGVATDSGVFTAQMARMVTNVDGLVLEANHDLEMLKNGSYPWPLKKRISGILGHLSNDTAGNALLRILGKATRKVMLAHLSTENNHPALALQTVQDILIDNQVNLDEVDITVAPRYKPSAIISI